tara:strand:- start:9 stop:779 length:771 start_codon:yes stop_codon:yes gene_type:complete
MSYYLFINKNIRLLLLLLVFFSSCITNRDLEYVGSSTKMSNTQVSLDDYKLQPGDLLSVQISTTTEQQHDFFNKENTSNSQLMLQNPYLYGYLIKDNGTLELPSFGILKAAGHTLSELEDIIKQIAVSYFEGPVVKINIINFQVTILGEVNNPGTFKIVDPQVNVLYALSLAGDMTQFGNRRKVKVIRNQNNINFVFYIDLTQKDILNDSNFMLHPNDIIYVSPIKDNLFRSINNLTSIVSISISAVTLFLLINQN